MAADPPLYCIDTCIDIDWLTADKAAPLQDILDVIQEIEEKKANLLVPVIAYVEVMEAKHAGKAITQFRGFLKRSNVIPVDVTIPLADKAEAIRSAAWKLKPKRSIRSADAIFIAASILFKATMLVTRDDKMLSLDGHGIVDGRKSRFLERPAGNGRSRGQLARYRRRVRCRRLSAAAVIPLLASGELSGLPASHMAVRTHGPGTRRVIPSNAAGHATSVDGTIRLANFSN